MIKKEKDVFKQNVEYQNFEKLKQKWSKKTAWWRTTFPKLIKQEKQSEIESILQEEFYIIQLLQEMIVAEQKDNSPAMQRLREKILLEEEIKTKRRITELLELQNDQKYSGKNDLILLMWHPELQKEYMHIIQSLPRSQIYTGYLTLRESYRNCVPFYLDMAHFMTKRNMPKAAFR